MHVFMLDLPFGGRERGRKRGRKEERRKRETERDAMSFLKGH
jgi:hypothetical protein